MSTTGFSVLDTYNFICDYAVAHKGNTPSQRLIAANCGFSSATAHSCVSALIKEGLLERIDGAVCVVRADFTLQPNARNFPSSKEKTTDVMPMTLIPKKLQGVNRKHLAKMGIKIGKAADDIYNLATYPPDWSYERVNDPNQESYLLADDAGIYRAIIYRRQMDNGAEVVFSLLEDT